jgi:hypothetical protein
MTAAYVSWRAQSRCHSSLTWSQVMGDGAGLDHALDGHLVGLFRDLGRGIADEVDLIAIVEGRQGCDGSAHLSPERRDDDFLAAGFLHSFDDARVLSEVHRGAVDGRLPGKDGLHRLQRKPRHNVVYSSGEFS